MVRFIRVRENMENLRGTKRANHDGLNPNCQSHARHLAQIIVKEPSCNQNVSILKSDPKLTSRRVIADEDMIFILFYDELRSSCTFICEKCKHQDFLKKIDPISSL